MASGVDRIKSADSVVAGHRRDPSDIIVEIAVWTIGIVTSLAVLYPILNVIALSLSDYISTVQNPARIIPGGTNFAAYRFLLFDSQSAVLFRSLGVTLSVVAVGTSLSMLLTIMVSFAISRRYVPGVGIITKLVVLSGVFNPTFIAVFLVLRWLGIYNTFFALIVPLLMNMYHIIILKSFFQQIPKSLEDSAIVDGAGYTRILLQIYLPVSIPAIVTVLLFTMVGYWNSFLPAVLFVRDPKLWTIQVMLREIVISADMSQMIAGSPTAEERNLFERARYAILLVTMVPVLIVYPFLQRYFTHGIMLGSLKG